MSRIGKLPIPIPKTITIKLDKNKIEIIGPYGNFIYRIPDEINVKIENNLIQIQKNEETKSAKQKYGLTRSLIYNMVMGSHNQFQKKLQMVGVGYRAQVKNKELILNVGYSHPILFKILDGLEVHIESNTNIIIKGADKQQVGLLASKIRAIRPPEPYKGKGIHYVGEKILRKAGKSGK